MGCCGAMRAIAALLWAAAAAAVPPDRVAHVFSETLFCQRDSLFSGLSQTLDDHPLFGFDFPDAVWRPRLPDFQPEASNRTAPSRVRLLSEFCQETLRTLDALAREWRVQTPEARGVPQVEIFTLHPLRLGEPNTLVCSVTNLFPPSAAIGWERGGQPLTQGVSTPQIYPVQVLDFRAFSYLEVVPRDGEVYSCTVKTPREQFGSMAYWVPKDPLSSDLPVTVACGVAIGLGGVFLIVGVTLIVRSSGLRTAEW